jgi:hypothetical protein
MAWAGTEKALIQRAVACFAIEHFRHLIESETEEAKRQTLLRLLADEEAKLRAFDNRRLSIWRNQSRASTMVN